MNIQSDDFVLFGLARTFKQDQTQIDARRKDLQRLAHPDKFVDQGAAAQRLAMQWSVRINEAWQRLRCPIKRAAYLCELGGAQVNADNNTLMPTDFLTQQMQWREDLDAAHSAEDHEQFRLRLNQAVHDALQKIEYLIDVQQAFQEAAGNVRELMFLQRLAEDACGQNVSGELWSAAAKLAEV